MWSVEWGAVCHNTSGTGGGTETESGTERGTETERKTKTWAGAEIKTGRGGTGAETEIGAGTRVRRGTGVAVTGAEIESGIETGAMAKETVGDTGGTGAEKGAGVRSLEARRREEEGRHLHLHHQVPDLACLPLH